MAKPNQMTKAEKLAEDAKDIVPPPNPLKKLLTSVTDFFKQPALNIAPTSPYYQVTANDKDLSSVANKLKMRDEQLIQFNNGQMTLPPTGSYIATQQEQAQPERGRGAGVTRPAQQNFSEAGYSDRTNTYASTVDRGPASSTVERATSPTSYREAGRSNVSATGQAAVNTAMGFNTFASFLELTNTPNYALLSAQVDLATVKAMDARGEFVDPNGKRIPPAQIMESYGYIWDTKTGNYINPNVPGAPAAGKPSTNAPGPGQAGYNPSGNKGGWVLQRKNNGELGWKLQGKKGSRASDEGAFVPALAPLENANVGSTTSTVLELRLGSG